jgi:hypothetical protein
MDQLYSTFQFEDRKTLLRNHTNRALEPQIQSLNLPKGAFSKNFFFLEIALLSFSKLFLYVKIAIF